MVLVRLKCFSILLCFSRISPRALSLSILMHLNRFHSCSIKGIIGPPFSFFTPLYSSAHPSLTHRSNIISMWKVNFRVILSWSESYCLYTGKAFSDLLCQPRGTTIIVTLSSWTYNSSFSQLVHFQFQLDLNCFWNSEIRIILIIHMFSNPYIGSKSINASTSKFSHSSSISLILL